MACVLAGCATPAQRKCDIANIPLLQAADSVQRIAAAERLGDCGNPAALDPLAGLLSASSEPVRAAGIAAIGRIGGDDAVVPLATALRQDKGTSVRLAAARGLAQYQDGRAERPLVRALIFDSWQEVRVEAARSLEQCCVAREYPIVYAGVDDWGDPGVLVEVAGPAGELATTTSNALLFTMFRDHSDVVRAAAARALAHSEADGVQPALVQALRSDPAARVRAAAASALGNMGDLDAQDALLAARNDPDSTVRDNVDLALANLNERF